MIRTSMAALAFALVAGAASAQARSPTEIINHHLAAAAAGDADAMASDYAEDAVVLQPGQVVHGRPAIRALFARMFGPGGQTPKIKPDKISEDGDVGLVAWHMEGSPVTGNDSFVIRDGKIVVQAVFISAPQSRP